MTNKKLGLLLLPLIPLSAIGIVEIADRVLSPEPTTTISKVKEIAPIVKPPMAPQAGADA